MRNFYCSNWANASVAVIFRSKKRSFAGEASLAKGDSGLSGVSGGVEETHGNLKPVVPLQGREVDVLILSTVRSQKRTGSGASIGFVADVRRMNVALTRARNSLWVVGNSAALKRNPHWAELVSDAMNRGLVVEARRPYSALLKRAMPGPSVNMDGEGGTTVSKGEKRPAEFIPLGRGKKPKVMERASGVKRKSAEGSLEVPAAKATRPNGVETSKDPEGKPTLGGQPDAGAEEKIAEAADFLKPALAPLKVPGSKGVPNTLPKAPKKGILKNAMSKLEAAGGQIPVVPLPPRAGGFGPAGPSGAAANQTPDWAPVMPRVSPLQAPQASSPSTAAPPESIFSKPIDVPISLTNTPAPLAVPLGQPPVPAVGQDKPGSGKMRDFGLRVEIPVFGGTITGHSLKPKSGLMQPGVETHGQDRRVPPPNAEMPLPQPLPGASVSETLDLPPGFERSAKVETGQKQKASLAVPSPSGLEARGQKEGMGPHPSTDETLPSAESAMERRIRELKEKLEKTDDQKRDVLDRKSDVESGEGGAQRVSRVGEEQEERDKERAEKERIAEEKERRNREYAKKYALAEKDRRAARDQEKRDDERDRYRGGSDRYRDKEKDRYGRGKRERSLERSPRNERDAEADRKRERRNELDSRRRQYSERGREGGCKHDESRGGGRGGFKVPPDRERGGSSTQRGKESPRGVERERGRGRSEEKTGGRSSIRRGGSGKESPRDLERRERFRSDERDQGGSRTPKEGFLREGRKGISRKDWRRGESEGKDRSRSRSPKRTSVRESPKRREREGHGRSGSEEKDRGAGRTSKERESPREPGREDRVRNRAGERDWGRSTTPRLGYVQESPGGLEDQTRSLGGEKEKRAGSSPKGVKDSPKSPEIEESGRGKSDGKRSDSKGGDRREGSEWRGGGAGQTEGEVIGRSKEGSQRGSGKGLNANQRDRSKGQDGQRGAEVRVDFNRNEDSRTGGHTGLQEEGLELTRKEESRRDNLPRSEEWLRPNQESLSRIRGPGKEVESVLNQEEDHWSGERSRSGRQVSEDDNQNVGGRSRADMGSGAKEHSDPYQKSARKDEEMQSMREEGQKVLPLEGSHSRVRGEGGLEANPTKESVSRDESPLVKQAGLKPDRKGNVSEEGARALETVRNKIGEEYQRVDVLEEDSGAKQRERSQPSQKLRPVLNAGVESTETLGVGVGKEARRSLGESLKTPREEQRSGKVSGLSEHGLTTNEKEASRNAAESRRDSGASLSSHQTACGNEGSVRSGSRNSDAAASVRSSVPCRYYPNCDKGDACRFAHVLPPCKYFRVGDCWKGKSCSFAHSQEAKPKEGQKETSTGQGLVTGLGATAAIALVPDKKAGGGSGEPSKARAAPEKLAGVRGAGEEAAGQNKTSNPVSVVNQGSKAGSEARRPEPTAAEPGASQGGSPAVSKNKRGGLASNVAPRIHSTISPKSSVLKKGGGVASNVGPKVHATDSPGLSDRKRQREEAAALMPAGSFRSQSARLAPASVQSAYAMPRSISDIGRRKTLPLGEELRRRVGIRGEIPGAEEGAEEGELVERKVEPRGGVNRPQLGGVNVVDVPQPRPDMSVPPMRGTAQGISPGRGRIQDRLSGPPFRGESRREDSGPGGFGPGPLRPPVLERLAFPPGAAPFVGVEEFRPKEERFLAMEEEREYLFREAMLREDARRGGMMMDDALAREGLMGRGRDVGFRGERVADERELRIVDAREAILRGERGAMIRDGMLGGDPNVVLQDERDLQGPFPNEPMDLREVLIRRNSQGFVGDGPMGEATANHRVPIHERLSRRPHPENGMQRPW
jgi:hypothetical protein